MKLNNNYEMPQVGFGLWKVDKETCADTVYNAIKTGYRLLDGACGKLNSYGPVIPELIASQTMEMRLKQGKVLLERLKMG
jgi:D-xylose reductase